MPLFPAANFVMQRVTGPTVSLVVDADFSRSKTFSQGQPTIIITVVQPDGTVVNFGSRPIRLGEKVHWEGRIPAAGTHVFNFVQQHLSSAWGKIEGNIQIKVLGDEKGSWSSIRSCDEAHRDKPGVCIAYTSKF